MAEYKVLHPQSDDDRHGGQEGTADKELTPQYCQSLL